MFTWLFMHSSFKFVIADNKNCLSVYQWVLSYTMFCGGCLLGF